MKSSSRIVKAVVAASLMVLLCQPAWVVAEEPDVLQGEQPVAEAELESDPDGALTPLEDDSQPTTVDAPMEEEATAEEEAAASDEDLVIAAEDTEADTAAAELEAQATTSSYFGEELTIADGLYEIKSSINQGLLIDISGGSTANGARIALHVRNTTAAQRYRFVRDASTGTYTITNVNSGRVLDVRGASITRGALVQQWGSNRSVAQRWRLYDAGNGRVYIVSELATATGQPLVLDVYNGKAVADARLQTWTSNGTAAQQWVLSPIKRTVKDGIYEVRSSKSSALLLDVYLAKRTNNANVWTWTHNGSPAQWWRVTYNSSTGFYTLVNHNSGKALEVTGGGYLPNTNIDIYAANASSKAQQWTIEANAGGGYVLRSALSGKAVDIANGSTKAGTNVRLWYANGSAAQGWSFVSPTMATIPAAGGIYQIMPVSNVRLSLDVANGAATNGANVRLWTGNGTNAQKWRVGKADSSGWRTIGAGHSTAVYLSVNSSGNICLATSASGDAQMWKIAASGFGFVLTNKATGKVMDIAGGNVAKGTNVRAYRSNGTSAQRFALVKTTLTGTPIMGTAVATQAQAVRFLKNTYAKNGWSLKEKWVKDGETIEKLVRYFWEEAAAEGVRADIALAQSCHETLYFQFGGTVTEDQYNFAGIGTTGKDVKGAEFKNARLGIRAQIQHLKAYASTAKLNKACVDPRFDLVTRGIAPNLEDLGNRWSANDPGYGYNIGNILNKMLAA